MNHSQSDSRSSDNDRRDTQPDVDLRNVDQLDAWMEFQLEQLLNDHSAWHTVTGNRKHFGR
ncbi:MAG: hypothetical protein P8J33_03545 [Pirellulaceae bacterium]|nr:hypothetical protein [Pirellulaceae bacterium]